MKFKLTFTQVLILALLIILALVFIAYTHNGVIDLRGQQSDMDNNRLASAINAFPQN